MTLIIHGGRVVDPATQCDAVMDLYIADGCIVGRGEAPREFQATRTIDAQGQLVFPGLIDLCARLREPGEEHKATIRSETRAAARGGITRMVCPPDTTPIIDTPAMVYMIQDRAQDAGHCQVHPLAALTVGLRGEQLTDMAMLQQAGCVGVSNGWAAVENTLVMRRAMQYASTFGLTVFVTPLDLWLQGNGVVHEGELSTRLGLPAIPEAAETVGVARDLALIETSGARAHFQLISCARSVEMLDEAQRRELPVTASVAIHHLLFCEHDVGEFDTLYKVMPPFRTRRDRARLLAGVAHGPISAICSDHQPHGAEAKLAPFSEAASGIAGLDTLLTLTYQLVRDNHLPLDRAIAALTCNPAHIIGLDTGHLRVGGRADICVFDPQHEWYLDATTMHSQGRNSPLFGQPLQGKVTATLFGGAVVVG